MKFYFRKVIKHFELPKTFSYSKCIINTRAPAKLHCVSSQSQSGPGLNRACALMAWA